MGSTRGNRRKENWKEAKESTVPDGGWGWLVCFACFFCHVFADGIMYSFGMIYVELLEYYEGSKLETAFVSSLSTGMCFLCSPVVAVLTDRFGCRVVVIIGSVVMSSGFIISIFAPNLRFLYFSIGILTGIGYGMIFLPSIVCVSQYFNKKQALATGIGVSGAGIGTFALSPLTSVLVQSYGWHGAMLIQAGLILNCVALGLFYVPIKVSTNKKDTELVVTICDKDVSVDNDNKLTGDETSKFQNENIATQPNCLNQVTLDADKNSSDVKSRHTHVFKDILRDILLSLKTSFDRSIFRNISFCTFLVSTFFYVLGYHIPYIYLPATAIEEGIDEFRASFLVSAIGITNTVGRVFFGFLSDRKCVNRMLLYSTALLICGAATCVSPFLKSFETLLVYSMVYGAFSGLTVSLTPVILSDIVGVNLLAGAFGVSNFVEGVSSLAGPPLAGLMYDVSKSYLITYTAAGSAIFLSGAILLMARFVLPRNRMNWK